MPGSSLAPATSVMRLTRSPPTLGTLGERGDARIRDDLGRRLQSLRPLCKAFASRAYSNAAFA